MDQKQLVATNKEFRHIFPLSHLFQETWVTLQNCIAQCCSRSQKLGLGTLNLPNKMGDGQISPLRILRIFPYGSMEIGEYIREFERVQIKSVLQKEDDLIIAHILN